MRNDEFNKIEVTNEKQTIGFEFGKTQKLEATSQKENKSPEGELNEKYVGKTIRKQTEVNVQYENKAVAPAHGSTTVTSATSATTAGNVAAATASVATAATVVAVTAVSVAAGISVALHDYDYHFNYFQVSENALYYELYVVDHKNERPDGEEYESYDDIPPEQEISEEEELEKAPLKLRVYNDYYDYSVATYLDINWGEFTKLKPDQQYHITLTENRFNGEVIFDDVFSTPKEETRVSEIRGITWDKKCNFLTNVTTVQLDYQDDYELYSDFKFMLSSEMVTADGPLTLIYDLEKTTEPQDIQLDSNPSFNLALTYDYSFTYVENGETKTIESGSLQFEDNSGAESKFNEFIFPKTANFINRTFEVQLDYQDDFNVFDNFVLTFIYTRRDEGDDMPRVDIPLRKTNEVQTVDLDGYEVMLSDSYKYELSCEYYGEKTILDSGSVTFTDISGAVVEFRELKFDKKANFDTRTFEVQLDYQDDLGYLYGFQFTLTDLDNSEERTFYLLEQTEVQTVTVDEVLEYIDEDPVYAIDIVNHRLSYSFKYMNQDQEVVVVAGEEFKFKNSLTSTFQGIETSYDFTSELVDGPFYLPMRFLYDDAAHVYQSFNVQVIADDQEVGNFMFEGETVKHDWMYGSLYSPNSYPLNPNDLSGSNVQIKVTASMLNVDAEENGGPDIIEQDVYLENNVTFTLNQNETIYGANIMSENIYAGDYQIGMMPIFSGDSDAFVVYFVFECETGNKYTCPFDMPSMGSYSYASLMECEEGFDEEAFWEAFENEVKISIKFCKVEEGVTPSESDFTTMVIHEGYKFTLSA